MPRSDRDNQEIRATRRAEILAAATQVFAERGVARTKVSDIAAAASLSHGLIYHYFPSKEAIFEAIAQEMIERADADLAAPHDRAIDRLRYTFARARERIASEEQIDATRVVLLAILMRDSMSEALHQRLSAHLVRLLQRTEDTIAQAQHEGDLDASIEPGELARVVMFLFRGMAIRVPDFPIPLPDPETLLRLLRPQGHALVPCAAHARGRTDA